MKGGDHTPGPWKDGPVFQKEGRAIFFTDTSKPGKWQKRLDDKTGVFSEGDAALISAAPDMLEALEVARNGLQWFIDDNGGGNESDYEALKQIYAAIAKAHGGAS